MARMVDTKEYLDTVCQLLREGKENVCVPVKGFSMRPFLHDQDLVYLNLVTRAAKPGDILLFQRFTGQYVLHRVYRCLPEGDYLMLGDFQDTQERIAPHQIRAIVSYARVKGQLIRPGDARWWLYSHPWRWLAPVRGSIIHGYSAIRRK